MNTLTYPGHHTQRRYITESRQHLRKKSSNEIKQYRAHLAVSIIVECVKIREKCLTEDI